MSKSGGKSKRHNKQELFSLLSFGWGGSFLKVLRAEAEVVLPDHVERSVNTILVCCCTPIVES